MSNIRKIKKKKQNQLLQINFERVFSQGKIAFANYLAKNNINKPTTEEEAYYIIKKA